MSEDKFIIRPITENDFDWVFDLSNRVDLGFTSLPNHEEYLKDRLSKVAKSFAEDLPVSQRIYFFVRENLPSGQLVGMSGIQACAGCNNIFYNFEISSITQLNRTMDIKFDHKTLNLVDNFQSATELISFWVDPNQRGKGYGKPLSFSRLLYMSQFADLFGHEVIAEIRGVCDEEGKSPFWEAVGKPFFGMEFVTADYLTMSTDKQFIADLIPRLPIYIDLLPRKAQQVIGKPHETAEVAKKFLESQGLKYRNYVDIFDGGPLISAELKEIDVITNSRSATVKRIENNLNQATSVIIGTQDIAMVSTVGQILEEEDGIIVTNDIAEILQVQVGAEVRYASI